MTIVSRILPINPFFNLPSTATNEDILLTLGVAERSNEGVIYGLPAARIRAVTSDPSDPDTGDIWLRTDL